MSDGALHVQIEQLCIRNLLGASGERFFFKDRESRFLLVSAGWREAIAPGVAPEEIPGKTDFDFFTRPHAAAAYEDERRIIESGEPMAAKVERETFADRPDEWVSTSKWPLRDADGEIVGTFGISRDVTAQMRDPVTGLANRLALMDRLRQAIGALERQPGRLALLFIDIDGFKQVNDTWGHRAGDRVLVQIAERLLAVSRRFDTVARLGGDEFVVLVSALRADENLDGIGTRVTRALAAPLDVGAEVALSASIGAVVCGDPTADPLVILEAGDTAMYVAKREGGDRFVVFDAEHHQALGPHNMAPRAA